MKELINQHDSEGRHHGVWEWYRSDGTLAWKGYYHHGRVHGLREDYHSDGTLWWRAHWHHGEQRGLSTLWDTQGGIKDKAYHLVIR